MNPFTVSPCSDNCTSILPSSNYLDWQSWPPIEEASVAAASWAEILPGYFPSPPPKAALTNDAPNPTTTALPPVSRTNNPNEISSQFIFHPVITQREALDLQSRYCLLANAPLPTRIPTPAPTPISSAPTPISFHDYAPHQQPPALIPRPRNPSVPVTAPSDTTFSASPSKKVNLPHHPTASSSQSKPTASQETEAYNALLALEQNRARFDVQKNLFELDDDIPKEKGCQWGLPAGEHPHTTPTDHRGAKEHLRKVHGLKLESSEKLACGLPGCVDSCDWGSIGRHLEREKHFHSARVHCRLCGGGNQVRGGTVRGRDHIRTACSWTRPEITLEKLRERLIESGVFKGDLTLPEMSTSHSIASTSARGNKRRKLSED